MKVKDAITVVLESDIPDAVKAEVVSTLKGNSNLVLPMGVLGNIVYGKRTFDDKSIFGYNVEGGILDIDKIGVFPVTYIREAVKEDILGILTKENKWRSFELVDSRDFIPRVLK